MSGIVKSVEPGSASSIAGVQPGDIVTHINGHALRDVIDAQFYGSDAALIFEVLRGGHAQPLTTQRAFGQALGLEFEHPTFDIDIRRCNNLCPFCFVLQNAPRMRRTLYIKDDDYRYSFLFGHYVTLTNLSQDDWDRIAEQRLSPLYVSVHATDLAVRRTCLRNSNAPDVMQQLRWLAEHGISVHTQLVITPGLNDGAQLDQSVRDLASLHPNVMTISVVPVGLTRHHKYGHRVHTVHEAKTMIERLESWQRDSLSKRGTRFVFLTDEWYLVAARPVPVRRAYEHHDLRSNGLGMVRDFLDEWRRVRSSELTPQAATSKTAKPPSSKQPLANARYRSAILVTGTLFAPILTKIAREFSEHTGLGLEVVPVVNTTLGDTITVAGLLNGLDIIHALQSLRSGDALAQADIVILPRIAFDHPDGVALDDISPLDIARALHKPVTLADWMGDVVDALTDKTTLLFAPDAASNAVPIVRAGGWAVEKYL